MDKEIARLNIVAVIFDDKREFLVKVGKWCFSGEEIKKHFKKP